ncbi:TPA: hypothetical protein ACVU4H_001221 [Vibrio parahaemolyticus]
MKDFKESTKESNLYFINAAELDFPTEKSFKDFTLKILLIILAAYLMK